ncbi:hypothetical protein [Rhodococcus koreensis]|jgi:hypothetical protein|uniref:hypothetical protein n=1 Tax=Rhodococcus koreensis TaxID=99653 RepID=UPI00197F6805|nr:hypothetical protein [Rhodococcus koreensis]QSE84817.1 hypothetical protein JWS14_39880 [Rhodococcus koreensis]
MTAHKNPPVGPTTDHERIRCWIQHHHGAPATTTRLPARPASATTTLLVDFAGLRPGSGLEHISWKQWFALFDAQALAFRFPGTEDSLAFELIPRTTGRPAGRHQTTPRPAPE